MNETVSKRRIWIRNIIIIILAVLLILTFCSQSIMNRSLPEVAVQYPQYGAIASRIRATGTVEANQSYTVTIAQSRVVSAVNVRTGQSVAKGDVLLTLEEGDSTELDAAKSVLSDLNIQLLEKLKQDPSLQDSSAADTYASLVAELKLAKEDLDALKAQKKQIPTYDQIQNAKTVIAQAESMIEFYTTEIARLGGKQGVLGGNGFYTAEEIENLLGKAQAAYDVAEDAYNDAAFLYDRAAKEVSGWQSQIDAAQTAYDNAAKAVSDYESTMPSGSVTMESLMQAQKNLE